MLLPLWRMFAGTGRPGGHPKPTLIVPNLLVGEYPTPDDVEWLRATHGVTTVLSLQEDADLASKGLTLAELEQVYRLHGIGFHRVPLPDGDLEYLAAWVDRLVSLLDQLLDRGECVYLHCNAGLNRAPTVAIAYLHAACGLPLHAARDLVKQRRHCVPYMGVLEARYGVASDGVDG